jgi:hypothetical protein
MNTDHHATLVRAHSPRDFSLSAEHVLIQQEQWVITSDSFGIDEVRGLVTRAYQRPSERGEQLLVVRTDFITHEAQNALLKVLEEPPLSTKFLFIVPPDLFILPTLFSRFTVTSNEVTVTTDQEDILATFLKLSLGERIALIDAKLKANDLVWQRAMKQGMITWFNTLSKVNHLQLPALEFVARSLLTRGASNKMLLEHAALLLPVS